MMSADDEPSQSSENTLNIRPSNTFYSNNFMTKSNIDHDHLKKSTNCSPHLHTLVDFLL